MNSQAFLNAIKLSVLGYRLNLLKYLFFSWISFLISSLHHGNNLLKITPDYLDVLFAAPIVVVISNSILSSRWSDIFGKLMLLIMLMLHRLIF